MDKCNNIHFFIFQRYIFLNFKYFSLHKVTPGRKRGGRHPVVELGSVFDNDLVIRGAGEVGELRIEAQVIIVRILATQLYTRDWGKAWGCFYNRRESHMSEGWPIAVLMCCL